MVVVLGNPNVGKMNTEAAAARDAKLKPVFKAMRGKPYREIAEGLTSRNIPTPRGGDAWNAMSVMRSMKRLHGQTSLRLLRALDVISLTDKNSVLRHLHEQ